ncbi:MAG: hypothetical protein L0H96_13415 [Humibacillus sp.]|nr:hypothetical protein [Humibacillus sp.]MDN5777899.1 hypothetical protein [Humibacillus sp.]
MKFHRPFARTPLRLVSVAGAALALGLAWAVPAQASQGSTHCAGGPLSGTYRNLVVTGECDVVGPVTVNGSVTITGKGAAFSSEYPGSPAVRIRGNVLVSNGGLFAFGQPTEGCGPEVRATSVVTGNVVALKALSVKILCSTVRGNVLSVGGGYHAQPDCLTNNGVNFPVKDNAIRGNLAVYGWSGCWMGVIRNHVGGNVILVGNTSAAFEPGTTNLDGMEIVTNTIRANLACYLNSPHPQVGDSEGAPNQVAGHKLGQCRSL